MGLAILTPGSSLTREYDAAPGLSLAPEGAVQTKARHPMLGAKNASSSFHLDVSCDRPLRYNK